MSVVEEGRSKKDPSFFFSAFRESRSGLLGCLVIASVAMSRFIDKVAFFI